MKKKHILFLVLIILLAAFFRFHLIRTMPGGLFPDEAANGLDVNNIFKGHWQPFFARGNGREALFFYLEAISAAIFGRGPWQFHIVSATIGVLSVIGCYLMTSKLYDRTTGLLAAFLMAVSPWHIVLSRTAFRAIQIPLFTSLSIFFFAKTIQAKSKHEQYWSAVFAGIFFAGGFYTYIAFRIMPAIIAIIIALLLIADYRQNFKWVKSYYASFIIACIAAIITFAPIGMYFVSHPGSFVGRSGQVSVFNSDLNHGHLLGTIADVAYKSMRAYFKDGDTNWRQNISGQPFLSPLISPFFAIGLIVLTILSIIFIWQCLRAKKETPPNTAYLKHITIIGLFFGMLMPVITTAEGIPHGLRSIGTLMPAYVISAVALVYVGRQVMRFWHRRWMEYLYKFVVLVFLATLAFVAYAQYFVYAYNVPNTNPGDTVDAFRSDLTSVSNYINNHPDKAHTFLVLDLFSVQTVDFLTTQSNNPYVIVDPANSYKLHIQKGDTVIFTASTLYDAAKFVRYHKNITQSTTIYNRFGQEDMLAYTATSNDPSSSLGISADGTFAGLNLGDKVYWSWINQSFEPWTIKIWSCDNSACNNPTLIKQNNQNDYFANNDYILIDGSKKDLYYKAAAYNAQGLPIYNFGIIKLAKY